MALNLDHLYHGSTMTDAYYKVVYVSGNKDKLHIDVEVYQNATEADNGNKADSFSFAMEAGDMSHADDASDKNYTKQAYEYMKAGAFDDLQGVSRDYTSAVDV